MRANDAEPGGPGAGTAMVDAVGPLWTAHRTAAALGVTQAVMSERRETGTLLGLKTTDDDYFYPVAQFERSADGVTRVKPALRGFLETLRALDPWSVAILLRTPAPELDDLCPLDWVRRSRDGGALDDYASVLNAEWLR